MSSHFHHIWCFMTQVSTFKELKLTTGEELKCSCSVLHIFDVLDVNVILGFLERKTEFPK